MKSEFSTNTKENLRKQAKKTRNNLDIEKISQGIFNQILTLESFKKAKFVAGFYPFDNEIDLRSLYQVKPESLYFPKVENGTKMTFHLYKSLSEMSKNKYGILEPASGNMIEPEKIDLIIVPGLMVDTKGNRLGYGKGYYDRFLPKLKKNCIKILPIPEELVINELPADEFDIPVDIAVTQEKIHYFNKELKEF